MPERQIPGMDRANDRALENSKFFDHIQDQQQPNFLSEFVPTVFADKNGDGRPDFWGFDLDTNSAITGFSGAGDFFVNISALTGRTFIELSGGTAEFAFLEDVSLFDVNVGVVENANFQPFAPQTRWEFFDANDTLLIKTTAGGVYAIGAPQFFNLIGVNNDGMNFGYANFTEFFI
jgi:hypothetical protein